MPELPEVETIKRDLQKKIKEQVIVGIRIKDGRVVRHASQRKFVQGLKGQRIVGVSRYGKALVFALSPSDKKLVVQLMMTGQLIYAAEQIDTKETKIIFSLSNGGYLHYNDQRLFGQLRLVRDLNEVKYFRILGMEPLSKGFNAGWIKRNISGRKGPVKSLLMNHTFVAGIGNIYASEILFAAGIRPQRPAASLKDREIANLHRAVTGILKKAIKHRGTSMRNYRDSDGNKGDFIKHLRVYGRENDRCFSCGGRIEKVVQSGRSTFYCPKCQF